MADIVTRADLEKVNAEIEARLEQQDRANRRTINVGSPMTQAARQRRFERDMGELREKRNAILSALAVEHDDDREW